MHSLSCEPDDDINSEVSGFTRLKAEGKDGSLNGRVKKVQAAGLISIVLVITMQAIRTWPNHALQRTAGGPSVTCWTISGPPSLSFCR